MGPTTWRRAGWAAGLLGACLAGCGKERPPVLPFESNVPDMEPSPPQDAGPGPRRPSTPPGRFSSVVGATHTPDVPPPSISGGTLLLTRDGRLAVAADPERDRLSVVDLVAGTLQGHVALQPGDEPGRLVEDAAGRVHVALRRGGALVTVDPATRTIVARRAVCPAPRGVAHDPASDLVHVACAGGELVSLPAGGGSEARRLLLDRDLRDVVVRGAQLVVSRFRNAELLTLDAAGTVVRRVRPVDVEEMPTRGGPALGGRAGVAWRTVPRAGGVLVLHQRALVGAVDIRAGGYGGGAGCRTGVVQSALSFVGLTAPAASPSLSAVALAVDVAQSVDGERIAVAVPGNRLLPDVDQVVTYRTDALSAGGSPGCLGGSSIAVRTGQVVAVAVAADGRVVFQTREPAMVQAEGGLMIPLGGDAREDTGHTLFHANAGGFVTCASCHPEGGDDGHVWHFTPIGARRTQNLRGGLAGTAPFHWDGDMPTFEHLAADVFSQRMSGGVLRPDQVASLERWATTLPAVPAGAPHDPAAVARGRSLFEDPTVGCATCHAGEHLTNNLTLDVGTGGAFQVPSLRGVAARTPLMHDGCATTLRDRFGTCGGDHHGQTRQLVSSQIDDLVAYLETL